MNGLSLQSVIKHPIVSSLVASAIFALIMFVFFGSDDVEFRIKVTVKSSDGNREIKEEKITKELNPILRFPWKPYYFKLSVSQLVNGKECDKGEIRNNEQNYPLETTINRVPESGSSLRFGCNQKESTIQCFIDPKKPSLC